MIMANFYSRCHAIFMNDFLDMIIQFSIVTFTFMRLHVICIEVTPYNIVNCFKIPTEVVQMTLRNKDQV